MILAQIILEHCQGQFIIVRQIIQIIWQPRSKDLAGKTPVVLILVIAFDGAGNQIIDIVAPQNIEAVDSLKMTEILDLPSGVCGKSIYDARLSVVVGGIHPVRSEKGPVGRTGNLNGRHGAARFLPYFVYLLAVTVEQQA